MNASLRTVLVVLILILLIGPEPTYAYGGPGSVISGIGAFLAAVAALLAALFGFIWFPLKRLYRRMTEEEGSSEEVAANPPGE